MERVKTSLGDLPVNYGWNAYSTFSEMRGMSMTESVNLNPDKLGLMDYLTLLYVGLKDGARKAKEDFKFENFEAFCDYADEHNDIVSDVATIFGNSQNKEKTGKDVKPKKK